MKVLIVRARSSNLDKVGPTPAIRILLTKAYHHHCRCRRHCCPCLLLLGLDLLVALALHIALDLLVNLGVLVDLGLILLVDLGLLVVLALLVDLGLNLRIVLKSIFTVKITK